MGDTKPSGERLTLPHGFIEAVKEVEQARQRMHSGRVLALFLAGATTRELCRAFCCTLDEIEAAIRRQVARNRRKRLAKRYAREAARR